MEILQEMFLLEAEEDLTIQYLDNESELCKITSDWELQESFNAKNGEILKLEVTKSSVMTQKESPQIEKISINNAECNDFESKIKAAISEAFDFIVETINPIFQKLDETTKEAVVLLKPRIESFLNDPSILFKEPFESFLNEIDKWLVSFDFFMSKSQQEKEPTPESGEQSLPDQLNLSEIIMNEAKKFLDGIDEWLARMNDMVNQKSQDEDSLSETSDQPFATSLIRPLKDLYKKVIDEVENKSTEVEEVRLFDYQMQELRNMGFKDDDQNLAILMQTKGDLLCAVIVLLDAEKA